MHAILILKAPSKTQRRNDIDHRSCEHCVVKMGVSPHNLEDGVVYTGPRATKETTERHASPLYNKNCIEESAFPFHS